jgi:hypothetical protein
MMLRYSTRYSVLNQVQEHTESPKNNSYREVTGQIRNDVCSAKSRRDDTLLTVGFNLRTSITTRAPKSRRDDTSTFTSKTKTS